MKAKVLETSVGSPFVGTWYGKEVYAPLIERTQVISVHGVGVEMRIEMKSTNGFFFPMGGDLELEIKITHTPEKPTSQTTVIK